MAKGEGDDIAAALLAKAEELKTSSGTEGSTAIGAVRKYLPAIEELLKAPGATYGTVLSILRSKGIEMSEATFATNLTKARKEQPDYVPKRGKTPSPRTPGQRPVRAPAAVSQPVTPAPAKPATAPSTVATPASDAPVQPKKRDLNREL